MRLADPVIRHDRLRTLLLCSTYERSRAKLHFSREITFPNLQSWHFASADLDGVIRVEFADARRISMRTRLFPKATATRSSCVPYLRNSARPASDEVTGISPPTQIDEGRPSVTTIVGSARTRPRLF